MRYKLPLVILLFNYFVNAQTYEILKHEHPINIVELPQLNSKSRECNISLLPEGKTLFFMTHRPRPDGSSIGGSGDIYQSNFVNNTWQTPVPLSSINTNSGEDEPTFSKDGTEMFYQSWAGNWQTAGGPYYRAKLVNGVWKKQGSMGSNINLFFSLQSKTSFGYGTDGMAVSADGNLFIVACGPDYNGPMDLYYSVRTSNGWSYPEIMGVSTDGDERSVFIAADNRTIYFSSDGMGGFGGLDIFKVRIDENGKLGEPVNIGAPFNTAEDDMGFVASADGRSAFFIRNLDIYFADISELTEKIKPIDPIHKEKVEDNPIPIEKPEKEETKNMTSTVYFDHDRSTLNQVECTKLKAITNGNTPLHIHGYCDSDGSETYNMDLAKRRCEKVITELVKLGFNRNMLILHVHGEQNPVESNGTETGKAKNRRVEIQLN